ncbi:MULTISPECIES: OmpA family protein [unclassified Serratia (in: enterobacteria)]|uniref:OmpA family protein n=1 Tax=unclassified Serratia (in: enterobacteria) TaxID=2647522 RepID=UPI000502F259|nr:MULTISPECIES: OmpA family protein [unclassified Serratia (in: enterobacteria)]KFK91924.1 membrane protein [Serratia sp. Ag2]KFK93118.1 membrane protein [Serratia sp. Ag1]
MRPRWRQGLWLWAGLLASLLCLVFLPFSPSVRWAALLLVVVIGAIGLWRAGRQPEFALADTHFDGLPPDNYRLPVVLVCGEGLDSLFGTEMLCQSVQGCWLRVDESSQLRQSVQQLLWQRPAWAGQLAVMIAVNPQQQADARALSTTLHELRWQLGQLRRDTRCPVPLILCSTVATSLASTLVWLSQQRASPFTLWPSVNQPETLADWQRQGNQTQQAARVQQTVLFRSHQDWLQAQVLPALQTHSDDVAAVSPQQVILHQVSSLPGQASVSLWQQWLAAHTALSRVAGWCPKPVTDGRALPFPDFIFSTLPMGRGISPRQQALRHAVTLLGVAAVVALCSSAWQNRQLVQRVAFDIRHYDSVENQDHALKARAVEVLRKDMALLDDQFRNGEPLRLGLGLYQGERLRQPLMAAIKDYVPPALASVSPGTSTTETPDSVRLDSLSLFDTGKATLKPNATKVLVEALMTIQAKPGELIVVAGHTDSTGDARANQQLSLKRAEAVRDWMIQNSAVPASCFAVQGFGARQPVGPNTTPAGRAANRRVEISLVPAASACPGPETLTRSPEQVTLLRQ